MKKYKVETFLLEDDKELWEENKEHLDEWTGVMRIYHNGKCVRTEFDDMPPEDVKFGRDLMWIKDALEEAYKLGYNDGKKQTTS